MSRLRALLGPHPGRHTRAALNAAKAAAERPQPPPEPAALQPISRYGVPYQEIA